MKIEAEVGQRRDRNHLHLLDAAVRLERKADERVRFKAAIMPSGNERVVLPMFEVAYEQRRKRPGLAERRSAR